MSHERKNLTVELPSWPIRIISAALAIVTIHYIGFFSTLTDNYFVMMSTSLLSRVAWELASTLATTSLYVAVLLLLTGLMKGILLGIANAASKEILEDIVGGIDVYSPNPIRIAGLYIAVLTTTYFPFESPLLERTIFLFAGLCMLGLLYLVFFHELKADTGWSRFVEPLRHRELAIRALIAFSLSISFFAGKGFAWSLLNSKPTQISMESGEIWASIIDSTDAALLVKNDSGLMLLPMHKIHKVTWVDDSTAATLFP